jgi:transposase
MGRPIRIEWHDDAEALFKRYRAERDPELKVRWHALWLVRQGKTIREAAKLVGVQERSVSRWVAWYRQGGLAAVASHRRGNPYGRPSRLDAEQQAEFEAQAKEGKFRTAGEAQRWVERRFGVRYTHWGIRSMFRSKRWKKKVPRPIAAKANEEVQRAWKKGAFQAASRELA